MRALRGRGVEYFEDPLNVKMTAQFNRNPCATGERAELVAGTLRPSLTSRFGGGKSVTESQQFARINACEIVNSLLITFQRAAECTVSRDTVDPQTLFRSSLFSRNANKSGVIHWANAESISWGVPGCHPNRTDTFRLMGLQTSSQTTNLLRRFLRKNAGAKIPKPKPQVKGR
jgi:hypothetical protein